MSSPDFTVVNRVRAWDRINGQSVTVRRQDYDPRMLEILVTADAEGMSHWVPAEALDYRYFGEPYDADWGVRRQWARRAAADRRTFWRSVHSLSHAGLRRELRDAEIRVTLASSPPLLPPPSWGHRLVLAEVARRASRRPVYEVDLPADHRELARRRAASRSREAQRAWEEWHAADTAETGEQ
jgi:hypothetical protein